MSLFQPSQLSMEQHLLHVPSLQMVRPTVRRAAKTIQELMPRLRERAVGGGTEGEEGGVIVRHTR